MRMRCRIGAETSHLIEAKLPEAVAARRDQNEDTPTMRPRACREGGGSMAGWRGEELEKKGRISAGGVTRDATFVDAKDDLDDRIDDAYRTKHRRYSPGIAGSVLTPQARSATTRLVPRPTTS
jgi:hypothetical protein